MGNSISAASLLTASAQSALPDSFHDGSVEADDHLQQQIKKGSQAVVKSIAIYKTPLQQGARSVRGEGMFAFFHHHFVVVVLELGDVQDPKQDQDLDLNGREQRIIVAEKVGRDINGENTGIAVMSVPLLNENDFKVKFKAADLNVSISIAQLVEILSGHPPHYDILNDNCWKYANDTVTALLKAFGDLHPEMRPCMESHIQSLQRLVMPAEYINTGAQILVSVMGMIGAGVLLSSILLESLSGSQPSLKKRDDDGPEK